MRRSRGVLPAATIVAVTTAPVAPAVPAVAPVTVVGKGQAGDAQDEGDGNGGNQGFACVFLFHIYLLDLDVLAGIIPEFIGLFPSDLCSGKFIFQMACQGVSV